MLPSWSVEGKCVSDVISDTLILPFALLLLLLFLLLRLLMHLALGRESSGREVLNPFINRLVIDY